VTASHYRERNVERFSECYIASAAHRAWVPMITLASRDQAKASCSFCAISKDHVRSDFVVSATSVALQEMAIVHHDLQHAHKSTYRGTSSRGWVEK
jgi:hypothetical protein